MAATGRARGSAGGSKEGLTLGLVPLHVIEIKSKEAFGMILSPGLGDDINGDVEGENSIGI